MCFLYLSVNTVWTYLNFGEPTARVCPGNILMPWTSILLYYFFIVKITYLPYTLAINCDKFCLHIQEPVQFSIRDEKWCVYEVFWWWMTLTAIAACTRCLLHYGLNAGTRLGLERKNCLDTQIVILPQKISMLKEALKN